MPNVRLALLVVLLAACHQATHGGGAEDASVTTGDAADAPAISCPVPTADVELSPGDDLQAKIDASPEGTVFVLHPGVYRAASLQAKRGQQFYGERGPACERLAVLSGAQIVGGVAPLDGRFVATGQTTEGTTFMADCRAGYPRCGFPEDLFLDDVPLHHVASVDAVAPGAWFFDYPADTIYLGDDPAGHRLELSVTPVAIVGAPEGVWHGLVIEKYAPPEQGAAVNLGEGTVIEDCDVRLNHFAGIDTGPKSIARNNLVHDNGCFGFRGAGDGMLVEANEVAYNGFAGFNPFWGSGGSKWVYTSGLVVRGNFSHHNRGPGFWTDINNINVLYEDNIVEDNERGGIFHEIGYEATIRRNHLTHNGTGHDFPFWSTGAGVEVVSSRNVAVYDNVLVDNWQGITGLDDHRGTGTEGPWTLIGMDVHDNTVTSSLVDDGAGRTGIIDTMGAGAFAVDAGNRFAKNTYHLGPNARYFFWLGNDVTQAEWQGFGQDVP